MSHSHMDRWGFFWLHAYYQWSRHRYLGRARRRRDYHAPRVGADTNHAINPKGFVVIVSRPPKTNRTSPPSHIGSSQLFSARSDSREGILWAFACGKDTGG